MGSEEKFTDADGIEVCYRQWPLDGAAGAVVVAHGASEHSGRYARFAGVLNAAGYTVLAPDHRGHGGTSSSTGRGLIGARGITGVLDDLDHVVTLAQKAAGGGPVAMAGHSMGSIFALRYAQTHPDRLSALVLTGPIGVMPGVEQTIPQLQGAVAAGMGDTTMDTLLQFNAAFEPARTPFDWLSRDDAEVDAYLSDPLCGAGLPLSPGYLLAMSEGLRDGASQADALPSGFPVLLVAGEEDPVSNRTVQARQLAEVLRSADAVVTERYYPGARHEVLNEINRDEVQGDVVDWLARTVTGGGASTGE